MDDLLFRVTVEATLRLARSQLRLYICQLKVEENPALWGQLIITEQSLEKDAQLAWNRIQASWASDEVAARAMKNEAMKQGYRLARRQVQEHFVAVGVDLQWVTQRLLEFRG